jgi:hypothetical protein
MTPTVNDILTIARGEVVSVGFPAQPVVGILGEASFEPPWRGGLPGALSAAVVFFAGVTGLRIYLDRLTGTGYTHGVLAAPIAFLLATFFIALAINLGAPQLRHPSNSARPAAPPRTPGIALNAVRDQLIAALGVVPTPSPLLSTPLLSTW